MRIVSSNLTPSASSNVQPVNCVVHSLLFASVKMRMPFDWWGVTRIGENPATPGSSSRAKAQLWIISPPPPSYFRLAILSCRRNQEACDDESAEHTKNRGENDIGEIMRGDVHARESDQQRYR